MKISLQRGNTNTSINKSFKSPIVAQSNKPSRHEANEQVSTPNLVKGLKMWLVVIRSIPNSIQASIILGSATTVQ